MSPSARSSALLAFVGACVLLASGFSLALEGAGPYGSLPGVRIGVAIGAASAYFFVLWVASWASRWVSGVSETFRRNAAFAVLSLAAGVATFLAPLIPSASLAAACQSEALCPEATNPIVWSYLRLISGLPVLPVLVGIVVALVPAFLPTATESNVKRKKIPGRI